MRTSIVTIAILGSIYLLAGCEKTTPFTIDTSQITSTDLSGNLIGSSDPTDWTQDASWSETEKALFRADLVDLTGMERASIQMNSAYPNPSSGQTTLLFTTSVATKMRIVITDDKVNKLASYALQTDVGLNAYVLPFTSSIFQIGKNYRVYYVFDAPGQLMYYYGHGDISLRN
jgi:hypothetical protein